jgi:hypothetical protein
MARSDFLDLDLSAQCEALAGEINKVYQHLPWAVKNEAVARLKRQVHELPEQVKRAKASSGALKTQKHLKEALGLAHECVPLLSLCLKKNLLSNELHDRWIKRLGAIQVQLEEWLNGTGGS